MFLDCLLFLVGIYLPLYLKEQKSIKNMRNNKIFMKLNSQNPNKYGHLRAYKNNKANY